MSVPKNYSGLLCTKSTFTTRFSDSSGDGILSGFLIAPIIASALLHMASRQVKDRSLPTPNSWLIKPQPISLIALITIPLKKP